MFGSDKIKNTSIEKVLENPSCHTKASHTKNVKKWNEGKALTRIFHEVAKKYDMSYDTVKEIYFNSFALISNYMRHIDVPTIVIPKLGTLKPNTKTLNDLIDEGEYIMGKAIEAGYKSENEVPPFLEAMRRVRRRTKLESCYKRQSFMFTNKLDIELVDELYLAVRNNEEKRKKMIAYLFLNQPNGLELWEHLNKKYGEEFRPVDWEENIKKYNTRKNNY